MPRQHRASAQVVGSLSRFIRHHVDIFPVLVILPVLHDRQIDRTELIAYRFKVRPIPAVAAVINLLLPGNEQKTGPQRLVTLQPTAGKVPRRQHVDGELVAGRYRLLPVRFGNQRPVHSPVAQMRSDPQRRNDPLNFRQ